MLYRNERLVIRLRGDERSAIYRLAETERLPPSTLARKMLLDEAYRRGLLPANSIQQQDQEPG